MFEADTTYLWQTQHSVDAGILRASIPASFSQTQFGLSFNDHHADRGISVPVSAFFTPGKHSSTVHFQHKLTAAAVRVFR